MRKKGASSKSGQSLRVLMFFCAVVLMLVIISFVIKIAAIVAYSNFDGNHRFTIVSVDTPMQVVSFAPDTNTISILQLQSLKNPSQKHIANTLHIPIDGIVKDTKSQKDLGSGDKKDNIDAYLQYLFFSYPKISTNLTVVDIFRLWMMNKSVEPHNILTETLEKPVETMESAAVDQTASALFSDSTISDENKSIQIINGTGLAGVGNDVAQVLTNLGGNVVAVATAHSDAEKTKIIYTGSHVYTVKKLEKILQVKAVQVKKQDIFDIIVTIGRDKVSLLKE